MTSATTNGASLEDCLTNIFSLIDLNGIRWKRFKQKENNNYLYNPIDTHPILTTYSKCIEENHIAAWRQEPQKRHHSHGGVGPSGGGPGGSGSTGHSNFPTPTRTSNNNTPTGVGPTGSLAGATNSGNQHGVNNNQPGACGDNSGSNSSNLNNCELWIFGYGDQLKVDDVIGDDLIEIEDDTWEQRGLSYECRTLLFKALHNLIDKCFTNRGFTRIGRWFVQPLSDQSEHPINCHNTTNPMSSNEQLKPSKHLKTEQTSSINPPTPSNRTTDDLSSAISSTINSFIDSRREMFDSIKNMDRTDGLRHVSTRSSNTYFTTSLDGSRSSLSFAFSFFVHGNNTICATVDVRQHPLIHPLTRADLATFQAGGIVRVALAPHGLNGVLNGVNYKDSDNGAATTAFIQQWSKYYPLPKTLARLIPSNRLATTSNSAMTPSGTSNFHQKPPSSNTSNQSNQGIEGQTSRSYLSNLTNMLLPPTNRPALQFNHEPHEVPPVVEVIVAGHRMRYPSECVFTSARIVDHYRSTRAIPSPQKTTFSALSNKRPNKPGPIKPSRLSLLSEKLNEDKQDTRIKSELDADASKPQSPFNNPLKQISSTNSYDNISTKKIGVTASSVVNQPPNSNDNKDKNSTGCTDSDSNNGSTNTTFTTISRFNTKVVGFNPTFTPLGPTDLVKLFPTPPSLEQIILSPSAVAEESNNPSKDPVPSPANQNGTDAMKDNGIDVYRPVECALMPPPPKWAALTNIVIASSRSLPPECIYKTSSIRSERKDIVNKFCESIKGNLTSSVSNSKNSNKQLNSLLDRSSKNSPLPAPSPLADQTNKNGFNMNPPTPKSNIGSTSLLGSSITGSSIPIFSSNHQQPSVPPATDPLNIPTMSTFSAYTLPHQRLFNNLVEINSIQLNLMISDSVLGMFLDHNFENCTLCVCNMSIKGTPQDSIPHRDTNLWRQSSGNDNHNSSILSQESSNECTCGFSAITNRHYSHLSGLFFEDELEITNILYDPTEMIDQNKLFRKLRLSNYSDTSLNEEQKTLSRMLSSIDSTHGAGKTNPNKTDDASKSSMKLDRLVPIKTDDKQSSQSSLQVFEETKLFVIDQLKQQCSYTLHSNSPLTKELIVESFRNNRHLTNCTNYYAQGGLNRQAPGTSPLQKFLDADTSRYTTVKLYNRNPCSLKFSDFCELVKGMIVKLGNQANQQQNSRLTGGNLVKSSHQGLQSSNVASIFTRMFSPNKHQSSLMGKTIDSHNAGRNSIFLQGLQALVLPTLAIDTLGTLQMLEQLVKDESKEALATLNKAILIFSSPIHDWQFITAPIPKNFEVANLLKIIQPDLNEAVGHHNKLWKDYVHQRQQHDYSSRDSPSGAPTVPTPPCQGPLTWRQFHLAAGRGTEDQCEPQPIPSLLVSYHVDKSQIALSPFALKFWDKLLLEPYAPGHNIFYLVIGPDNPNTLGDMTTFFKELGNIYELLKLGKHIPIGNSNGIFATPESSANCDDAWFTKLNFDTRDMVAGQVVAKIKSYAAQMNSELVKTIIDFIDERQPPYDPHADRFESSPTPRHESTTTTAPTTMKSTNLIARPNNQQPTHVPAPNKTFSSMLGMNSSQHSATGFGVGGHMSTQMSSQPSQHDQLFNNYPYDSQQQQQQQQPDGSHQTAIKSQTLINPSTMSNVHGAGVGGNNEDNTYLEDEANKQSGIVIYIVDPFSSATMSQNLRALATFGLIRCYNLLLDQLPENLKRITQLQLISLDSIISHSRPVINLTRIDQLKSLSMNVYARCRKIMTNQITAKSLTGFGPAAALDQFFKTKSADICVSRMFTPPFILAPMKDKQTELGESYGHLREKSSVMFCSYCITEDQRWLLASVTNEKGELAESTVININVLNRMKKPRASVKRVALRKLMDFIVSVMSDWVIPWRLIIGKLGRVGHGELKEWANLLSKRSLLNYSRHLTEKCRQCSVLPPNETVSILSACLVSLEPDSKLRIMPDQFTSDDRQASFNKCPLSTPEDASCTHILVFPTSASIHPSQGNVEDPLVGSGLEDDLNFPLDDGIEDLGVEENMDDIFSACNDLNPFMMTDPISSHNDTLMSSSNLQIGSVSCGEGGGNQDETLQLLQQPLALGYYMSTAKIGQMPNWFWSTSPHLRNSCPVFLKSALHIHMPYVQLSDDLLHSNMVQSRKGHQLDSHMTTDVLRYVLEGYNSLSWLALNPKTYDRQSCLPVHMQNLLQLYHLMESFS